MASAALATGVAEAGPWARPAGRSYVRLGAARFEGRGAFLVNEAAAVGTFTGDALEFYGEAGLGRGLELDVSLRAVMNRVEGAGAATRSNAGPEDVEALLKWAPLSATRALSFVAGARVSLYERLSLAEMADGTPQRGPGGADLLTGFGYGVSFWPTRAWLAADVLHRLRLGGSSAGLRLRGEAGWMFAGPVGAALTGEFQAAYGRESTQPEGAPAPVPRVLAVGVKVLAEVYRGFGLSADGAWLPGVFNDGPGWRLGVSVTWERR